MANRTRGEASFETQDGRKLTLVVGYEAFAEAEDAADAPINDLLAAMSKGRMKAMRAIAFGALRERHPEITLADVGDMLLSPDSAALGKALRDAVGNAFPKAEEGADAGTENPPTETLGAGTGSRKDGPKRA